MEQKPIVFGAAGGTASGKTTVARTVLASVGAEKIAYLPHDAYYKDSPHLSLEERSQVNYDHPNSLDTDLLIHHVEELLAGRPIQMPIYDFTLHRRREETELVEPSPIIFVDGILILTNGRLRDLMDIKLYVDTDADVRFIRRLKRDMEERGRSLDSVVKQYLETVRPMHLEFVEPSKRYADIIIPGGGRNKVATGMLISQLRAMMDMDS